jgi:hypothetical protein
LGCFGVILGVLGCFGVIWGDLGWFLWVFWGVPQSTGFRFFRFPVSPVSSFEILVWFRVKSVRFLVSSSVLGLPARFSRIFLNFFVDFSTWMDLELTGAQKNAIRSIS